MKRIWLVLPVLGLLFLVGCGSSSGTNVGAGEKITVYKSQDCGCCGGYVAELEKQGFEVETVNMPDVSSIKQKYNIPGNLQSCHTSVIGDYFIEGHVPIEAVNKLLTEKPDIDGIGLAGMPSGAAGMPGPKKGAFSVYAIIDGSVSEFMSV